MMNKQTEEKILLLRMYFSYLQGAGHASALINGIANTENLIVLGSDSDDLRNTARLAGKILSPPATWEHFPEGVYGQDKPLVITDAALVQILGEVLDQLKDARAENWILKDMLRAAYQAREE